MRRITQTRIQKPLQQCARAPSILANPHSPLSGFIRLSKSFVPLKTNTCINGIQPYWTNQKRLLNTQTKVNETTKDVTKQEVPQTNQVMTEDSEDFQSSQMQDETQRKWFMNMQSFFTKQEYEKALQLFAQIRNQGKPSPLLFKLAMHCDAQKLDDRMLLEHSKQFLLEHGSNISTLSHILHLLGYYQKKDMFNMFWNLMEGKNELLPNDVGSCRRLVLGFCKLRRADQIRSYLENKRQEFPQNPHLLDALVFLHHHMQKSQTVVDLIAKALEENQQVNYYSLRKGMEHANYIEDWKHQEVFVEAITALQESGSKLPVYLRLQGLYKLKDFGKMLEIFKDNYGDLNTFLVPATQPQQQIPQRQIAARMISAYGALGMEKELLACFNFFKQVQHPSEPVLRAVMLFYSKKGDTDSLLKVFMEGLVRDQAGSRNAKDNKPYGRRWIHKSSVTSLIYCMEANNKIPKLLEILDHLRTLPELESIFYQHNIYLNLLPVLIKYKDDRNSIKWLQYYFQSVRHPRITPAHELLALLINLGKYDDAQGFVTALEIASETKPDREMYHSLISMWGKMNNSEKMYEVTKQMTLLGVYPTIRTHILIVDNLAVHKRFSDLVQYYKAVADQDAPELQNSIASILKQNGRDEELKELQSSKTNSNDS